MEIRGPKSELVQQAPQPGVGQASPPAAPALDDASLDRIEAPSPVQSPQLLPVDVTPGQGLQTIIAVRAAGDVTADRGFREATQAQVTALGASEFSPAAQRAVIHHLESSLRMPDDVERLTWARHAIREVALGEQGDLGLLRDYFRSKGMALMPGETLPAGHPGVQVQRSEFRAALRALEPADGEVGVIDRRAALGMLDMLKNSADKEDLAWCRKELQKKLRTGKLKLADTKTAALVEKFFASRAAGQLDQGELGLELHWMRRSGFAEKNVAQVRRLLEGCTDERALFYAGRALDRELGKARHSPENQTPEARARIDDVAAELSGYLEKRLDGMFDAYAEKRRAEKLFKAGKIDNRERLAMKAAAVTSRSHEEYAHGMMCAQVQLGIARGQDAIMDAWSDLCKTISENMSDDLRDAHGRIIETAEERQLKRTLERRQIERLTMEPARLKDLSTRAWLRASRNAAVSAHVGERDPARRADLQSAVAGVDNELDDLDPPLGPNS